MTPALSPSSNSSNLKRIESAPLLRDTEPADRYLYGTVDSEHIEQNAVSKKKATPLPLKQILLLALLRLSGPIAYSQYVNQLTNLDRELTVFGPKYVNEMLVDLGVVDDVSGVGYYSGVVDSVFSFVQLFTCLRMGMLADQIGRKPVLLIGQSGIVITTILFGLSKTFLWTIATRAWAGALSGNTMIINSAVGDLADESNQARAYAMIGLSYNVASVLGPTIGGSFAKPEETFPETLGKFGLFKRFPYLCPCLIRAFVAFAGVACCSLLFKETVIHRRPSLKQIESYFSSQDVGKDVLSARELTAWQLALDPILFSIFRSKFILVFLNTCATVVFTLFAYTPIEDGGLSRSPEEIGYAMALSGFLSGTAEVAFLAALQRRSGALTLMRFMIALWPVLFLLFPVSHYVARLATGIPLLGDHDHGHTRIGQIANVVIWITITILLLLLRIVTMAFPVNLILVRNAVPSDEILGTVFGLAQFIGSFARTFAPVFISSLFAFSKEHNVLDGNLVWIVMIAISLLGIWASMLIRDGRGVDPPEERLDE